MRKTLLQIFQNINRNVDFKLIFRHSDWLTVTSNDISI